MRNLLLCAALAAAAALPAAAQNKYHDAIERSQDAATIVKVLTTAVPGNDVPKELIEKAKAIGVFPKVKKVSALFMSSSQGYGVICAQGAGGWTMPAYYQFVGSGYGSPFTDSEVYGLVLLFMTDDAVDAFEKGGVKLKGERKALAGPVGSITEEQRKEIEGARILAYAYNGRLTGTTFGKSSWKKFMLNPDNNINKPLYGMKGREVLAGKEIKTSNIPDGIPAFKQALEKYFGAAK